jgi:hypothetical protein
MGMRAFVTTRGNVAVAPGIGGLLIAIVLAPFVLAMAVLAALLSGSAVVFGAVVGHRVRVSPAAFSRIGWSVAALIPAGLCVAFFGHAD